MMIDSILKSVDMIPAFPATIQKVAQLLGDEDYVVADVVNVIKFDQAVAANILKISNSAYFGARQNIKTIHDAVVYLGQQQLMREHSVAVALMSQILSRRIQQRENQVLYTASLLHDVGKIIMGVYVNEYFEKIMDRVKTEKCSFLEAEEAVIGINHADLGGRIADHWNFPPEIRNAIAYHHRPDLLEETDKTNAWLVYLSDQACLMMGIDGGADALAYDGLEEVMRFFDLRMVDLEKCFIILLDELDKAKDLMQV
jgi:putative nucleotidyltransferase with HDIG domain